MVKSLKCRYPSLHNFISDLEMIKKYLAFSYFWMVRLYVELEHFLKVISYKLSIMAMVIIPDFYFPSLKLLMIKQTRTN